MGLSIVGVCISSTFCRRKITDLQIGNLRDHQDLHALVTVILSKLICVEKGKVVLVTEFVQAQVWAGDIYLFSH